MPRSRPAALLLAALPPLLVLAGCPADVQGTAAERVAKPVTTYTLRELNPARRGRYTGLVTPYRQEEIGFEVSGRIEQVRDVGEELRGPVIDYQGREIAPGEVIAVLDSTRYQQQVDSLELRITSAEANLEAQLIDLREVATARVAAAEAQADAARDQVTAAEEDVKSAEAQLTLANQELRRQTSLVERGAGTRQALDQAKSNLDSAQAGFQRARATQEAQKNQVAAQLAALAEARATLKLKEAQITTTRAEIAELRQNLENAETDLQDCVLRAPFDGKITARRISRGGFVAAGSPVVELTLIDPVKVDVTVSAEDDRRIRLNAQVQLFPPELAETESHFGVVNEKSEVADPATRTFTVSAIARNRRVLPGDATGKPSAARGTVPVLQQYMGEGGPLFVGQACVYYEGGQPYVLRLPGLNFTRPFEVEIGPTIVPERIPVTFGAGHLTFLGRSFREVSGDDLRRGDLLLRFPRAEFVGGVTLEVPQWLLRPGDLVPVGVNLGRAPAGLYAPLRAVIELNGKLFVYVVEGGRVRRVEVQAHESLEDLRRITGDGLSEGTTIVLTGAHYLLDGDPVTVTGEEN